MEITVYEQTYSFLASVFSGFIIGIIYDFFKCIKSEFKVGSVLSNIADIVFLISAFMFFFFAFFKFNGFSVRIYHILGTFFGIILYFCTLNVIISHFFKIFLKIFKKILKILLYPVKFLCTIVNRMFVIFKKIYKYISDYVNGFFTKRIYNIKRLLKRRKKL